MTGERIITCGGRPVALVERGPQAAPALVLVHGLAQTLADWPDAFLDALCEHGFRVIAFDNRDVGRSARHDRAGPPPLLRQWLAMQLGLSWTPRLAYGLAEMADDVAALLDTLGIAQAHVLGVSMGGMVAQRLALSRPDRILSLACIMSSSGAPGLPSPRADVASALATRPAGTVGQAVRQAVAMRMLLAGELLSGDRAELGRRVKASIRRAWPVGDGPARQYAAIVADRDRWTLLARIACPTLVVHGDLDPLLPPLHGSDLAARIPGAAFELVAGLGHELPVSRAAFLAGLAARHALSCPSGPAFNIAASTSTQGAKA